MSFVEEISNIKTPISLEDLKESLDKKVDADHQILYLSMASLLPVYKSTKLFFKSQGRFFKAEDFIRRLYQYTLENKRPSFFFAPFFETLEKAKNKRCLLEAFFSFGEFSLDDRLVFLRRVCDFAFYLKKGNERVFLSKEELFSITSLESFHSIFLNKVKNPRITKSEKKGYFFLEGQGEMDLIIQNPLEPVFLVDKLWEIFPYNSLLLERVFRGIPWPISKAVEKDLQTSKDIAHKKYLLERPRSSLEIASLLEEVIPPTAPMFSQEKPDFNCFDFGFILKSPNPKESLKWIVEGTRPSPETQRTLCRFLWRHKKYARNINARSLYWYLKNQSFTLDRDLSIYLFKILGLDKDSKALKDEDMVLSDLSKEKDLDPIWAKRILLYLYGIRKKIQNKERTFHKLEDIEREILRVRKMAIENPEDNSTKLKAIFNR